MTNHPQAVPTEDPADFPDDTPSQSVDKLITQGTQIVQALGDLERAVDHQRRVQSVAIAVGALLIGVLAWVGLSNSGRIAEVKQQMCGAVVGIVPAPGEAGPPAGPEGDRAREVIGRFRVLATDFECQLRR